MRKSNGVFTPAEMKVALGAILIASVIAILALLMGGSLSQPPLGFYGSDFAAASAPGVLDAQPIAG